MRTTPPLRHTSDLQKTTSRLDTETTPHHSNTQNTETLPNSANIPGPLKKITLTTLFYGTSFHQDHPTTTQAKDATSASKKNYLSSTNLNYHHSINVMNTCPHATTETNNYCLTIEQSIEISRHALMQVCRLYKWWLWIFFTIKSPDEWVITKQACRDESIVSFFPYLIHIALYFYVSSTVQQKNQIPDFLYVYLCTVLREAHVLKGSSWDRFLASYNQPDN